MALSIIISLSVFLKVFNENTHPKKDLLIRSPYIDAIPGRKWKKNLWKTLILILKESRQEPTE